MNYIHFGFVLAVSLWLMPIVIDAYGDSYDSSSYLRVPRQMTVDEAMNTGRSMSFSNDNAVMSTNVTLSSNDAKLSTVNYVENTKQMTIDEVANMEKFTFVSISDNNSTLAVSNNTVVNNTVVIDTSSMNNQYVSKSFPDGMDEKINTKFTQGITAIVGDLKPLSSFSNLIPRLPGNVGNILGNVTTLEQTLLTNLINHQSP